MSTSDNQNRQKPSTFSRSATETTARETLARLNENVKRTPKPERPKSGGENNKPDRTN